LIFHVREPKNLIMRNVVIQQLGHKSYSTPPRVQIFS